MAEVPQSWQESAACLKPGLAETRSQRRRHISKISEVKTQSDPLHWILKELDFQVISSQRLGALPMPTEDQAEIRHLLDTFRLHRLATEHGLAGELRLRLHGDPQQS